jgi:hypothetical protein
VRSTSPSPLPARPPQEAAEGLSWQRAQHVAESSAGKASAGGR